jgi:hypothetical protein
MSLKLAFFTTLKYKYTGLFILFFQNKGTLLSL